MKWGDSPGIFFVARVFTPGSLLKAPVEVPIGFEQCRLVARPGTKILAGEPDQSNHSHFTIEVISPDAKGLVLTTVIDGWLLNDDSVLLEPRPPAGQ